MSIRILVRTDTDWSEMSIEKMIAQNRKVNGAITYLECVQYAIKHNLIDIWEEVFSIGFFEYRRQLQEIAFDSLEKTGCPITIGVDNFSFEDCEESIILPIDDDDFFAPNIQEIEDYFDETTEAAIWRHTARYHNRRWANVPFSSYWVKKSQSNNTAISMRFLRERDDRKRILTSHYWFHKKHVAESDNIKHIDECYGIKNVHSASISWMKNSHQYEPDFKKTCLRIKDRVNRNYWSIPGYCKWAEPYIEGIDKPLK